MDPRKKAMILDGATDLYTLIRDTLDISKDDRRVAVLDRATEAYLESVLTLDERERPQLHLVDGRS